MSPAVRQAAIAATLATGSPAFTSASFGAASGAAPQVSRAAQRQREVLALRFSSAAAKQLRPRDEIAAAIAARQQAGEARHRQMLEERKSRAAAAARAALAQLSAASAAAATFGAHRAPPPPPPPAQPQLQLLRPVAAKGGEGLAADLGHLDETPKAEAWRPSYAVVAEQAAIATVEAQRQKRVLRKPAPKPQLEARLLERTPSRLSSIARMTRAAAAGAGATNESLRSFASPSRSPSRSPPATKAAALAGDGDIYDDSEADGKGEFRSGDDEPGARGGAGASGSADNLLLTHASIAASQRVAAAKRLLAIEERRAAARVQTAAVTSRLALLHATRSREVAHRRVEQNAPEAATLRRAELLLSRAQKALQEAEHAASVGRRVRAARRLQSWVRFRRILKLGEEPESESGEREVADFIAASSPQASAALYPPPAVSRPSLSPDDAFSAVIEGSLVSRTIAARNAHSLLVGAASQHALQLLHRVLCGHPQLDSGKTLQEAREAAIAEEAQANLRAGRPPPNPLTSPEAPASSPFACFDDAALAIQQRGVLAAAQVVTTVIFRVLQALEESGAVVDANATAIAMQPAVSRSPRTLLASILLCYFPDEILSSGFVGGDAEAADGKAARTASASKRLRDTELVAAARRLLACAHALASCVLGDGAAASWSDARLDANERTKAARRAAYGLDGLTPDGGLDASIYVSPELRAALLSSTNGAAGADEDQSARTIHLVCSFGAAWSNASAQNNAHPPVPPLSLLASLLGNLSRPSAVLSIFHGVEGWGRIQGSLNAAAALSQAPCAPLRAGWGGSNAHRRGRCRARAAPRRSRRPARAAQGAARYSSWRRKRSQVGERANRRPRSRPSARGALEAEADARRTSACVRAGLASPASLACL